MDSIDWEVIAGAEQPNYDPELITQTTYFRRGMEATNCGDFAYSNVVSKKIIGLLSDGGEIAMGEKLPACNYAFPDSLVNVRPASELACGEIEYQWQSRLEGEDWINTIGANDLFLENPDYSLNAISIFYRRAAINAICEVTVYSNEIEIEPLQPISICLLYTSPSPRDRTTSRMPSSA